MGYGIVKYHNQMNEVNFNGYTEKELNLFFTLVFLAKEQETKKLSIPFNELKELSNGDIHSSRFIGTLKNVNKKLIKLNHEIEIDNRIHIFSLFNVFTIDKNSRELIVQVNEIFSYMLNDLIGNFTKFDLIEFVSLKSSYSKNTFKLLKQWETVNKRIFTVEEFKGLLAVPKGYTTAKFNERVLKPIMEELPKYFLTLNLEKIKTGKKITDLKFTWESKKEIVETKKAPEKIEISQELYNLIKEIQTLDFFKGIMTPLNIENLIKKYDEKILMQILKRARNNTYQKIKSTKYFDYVYDSIKNEPVITIKQSKKATKKEEQYQFENAEAFKKIDITRKDLNKKYKEYLEKIGLPDNVFMKKGFEMPYNIVEEES